VIPDVLRATEQPGTTSEKRTVHLTERKIGLLTAQGTKPNCSKGKLGARQPRTTREVGDSKLRNDQLREITAEFDIDSAS